MFNRMRIGIDARFYGSVGKGLGRYTQKLIEHLEILDTENEYVVFLRRENFSEYQPRNPRFHKVLAQYPWYGWAEQLLFPFLLLKYRLRVVHFPHFNVPILYPGVFVVTLHDLILLRHPTLRGTTRSVLFYWIKYGAYRLVIFCALRRAAKVITVSHFAKRDIVERYPFVCHKIEVTYEAVDDFCFMPTPRKTRVLFQRLGLIVKDEKSSENKSDRLVHDILKPYCLYVGNAYPHKNLEIFLDIASCFPEYQFVLVGKEDYFYRRLERQVTRRAVRNIIFSGFVDDSELGSLYRFASCYVFPSLYEGFGLPPLEAMNYGTPVLASDRASLPEILGAAALYADPDNTQMFTQRLRDLLETSETREQLRKRGHEQVALYHWSDMAKKTRLLYESVVQTKKYKNNEST